MGFPLYITMTSLFVDMCAIYGAPAHSPNAALHLHSTVISHLHGGRGSGEEGA